jgi:hypothetical protein
MESRGLEDRRAELMKLLQAQVETLETKSFARLTREEWGEFKDREAHIIELERALANRGQPPPAW